VLLYVGPDGPLLREALPDVPLVDAGRLSAEDVSRHLSVMNLHLTPFVDGVSTRRGSFMAGLQHGIPTVATSGDLTDSLLQDADGEAFRLAPTSDAALFAQAATDLYSNPLRRRHLGQNGQTLYDETFAFSVTVPAFLNILSDSEDAPHENNALYAHC
jgi:glycosyltransferase involved in cell wall biosynthesis